MADSDGEYVAEEYSDDDIGAHQIDGAGDYSTRSTGQVKAPVGSSTRRGDREGGGSRRRAAWEDIQRSWDTVVEGADGSINSTVEGLREAGKRKRSAIHSRSRCTSKTEVLQVTTGHNSSSARHNPTSTSCTGPLLRHD
jgi:hypothetical protein